MTGYCAEWIVDRLRAIDPWRLAIALVICSTCLGATRGQADTPAAKNDRLATVGQFKLLREIKDRAGCDALSPDARWLALESVQKDNNSLRSLKLWNLRSGTAIDAGANPVALRSLAFTPNNRQLVTVTSDARLKRWSVDTAQAVDELTIPPRSGAYHSQLSPDSKLVAVSFYREQAVGVFDTQNGKQLLFVDKLPGGTHFLRFSPGNRYLLFCGSSELNGKFNGTSYHRLYDLGTKSERHDPLPAGGHLIKAASFSADNTRLAIASFTDVKKIMIWNIPANKLERAVEFKSPNTDIQNDWPTELAFAGDGRSLLCGGTRGSLTLWNIDNGELLAAQPGEEQAVSHLQFAADGRTFCVVRGGEIVRLMRLPSIAAPKESSAPAATTKPPDAEAQAKALRLVKEIFQREFAAAQKPAEKSELARTLLTRAGESAELAENYVLLAQAKDLAAQGSDPQLFFRALDELGGGFAVDTAALALTGAESLGKASLSATARHDLADALLPLAERAAAAQDDDAAQKFLGLAIAAARKAKDPALLKSLSQRQFEWKDLKRAADAAKADQETLAKNPDDRAANQSLGNYYCFVKDDWPRGLPLLVRCADPAVKKLAEDELKAPDAAGEQMKLADAWYAYGQAAAKKDKARYLIRAANWYRSALPGLEGLQKTKAEKRLEELDALGAE